MIKVLTTIAALIALCSPTLPCQAARDVPTGFISETIEVQGKSYPYEVYIPRNYASFKKWPLIMHLHGVAGRGDDGLRAISPGLGETVIRDQKNLTDWPFVMVFPQCPNSCSWSDENTMLVAVLDSVCHQYAIDTDRVYLTGESLGGFGTWSFGAAHPDRFAALAPLCGGGDPTTLSTLAGMPIRVFHGAKDDVVPIAGDEAMVDSARKAGAIIDFTVYPDMGHDIWDRVYQTENLAAWLLTHRISDRRRGADEPLAGGRSAL